MAILVSKNIFLLNTLKSSYALGIDENGLLRHLYWGDKIDQIENFELERIHNRSGFHSAADMTMEECSSFGMMRYKETSMKVKFFDGTQDFRYDVKGYVIEGNLLTITLEDIYYPFQVKLFYQVFEEENMINRWREAINLGSEPIVIERFYSAEYGIKGKDFEITNYNGTWCGEFQLHSDNITSGKKVFESLRGLTSHVVNPVFMVHNGAKEDYGNVYYSVLEYSGNFKIVAEATPYDYVNLLIGISDTDFSLVLKPKETFLSPAAYAGYSNGGFGDMSRTLHHFCIAKLMPKATSNQVLKVLYNSWEATQFNVSYKAQMLLAEKAGELGAELFVVDDGWFGKRNNDLSSLGDWQVDLIKFPDGLEPLISHVKQVGMDFGIWIEPEMVNEDSDLFRNHPDWVYRYLNREILTGRNQYMLDLTKEEVVQYIFEAIDKLLVTYSISYIKWDMNRSVGETSNTLMKEGSSVWVAHTRNFYRIIDKLREKHPAVEFEACASGGGRVDYGTMRYFDQYWTSDNTDALDRLEIQRGYSFIYPAKYMRAWVTDSPNWINERSIPVTFRLHCAMAGSLGIGSNLNHMTEEEQAIIREHIELYKRIREIIQFGQLYRLKYYKEDDFHAIQYVKDNKSIVFVYLVQGYFGKDKYFLKLKGLELHQTYLINNDGVTYEKTGAYLMHHGLVLNLKGDYDSKIVQVEEK